MVGDPEEVVKEIHDADIPRVDAVDGPAHGMPFLILKSAEIEKAEKSTKAINDLPDSDFAYIEPGGKKDDEGKTVPRSLRHFPIMDEAHVRNALSRAPQSPFGDKAMPAIRAAAKKFGIDVTKAAEVPTAEDVPENDEVMDDADSAPDARDVLNGQAIEAPGDPDDPGSAAWEAVDAARARQLVAALTWVKQQVCEAADRESTEVVSGEGGDDDAEAACDLETAEDAIDYALSVLAPFAATEQAEADLRAAKIDALTKQLSAVVKAGRVLSASNEASLRSAAEAINNVLATLPAPTSEEAPVADTTVAKAVSEDAAGEPMASEAAEDTEPTHGAVVTVEKAKGDPQVAVYDRNGNLVGTIDPSDLSPIADAQPPKGADDDSKDADAADEPEAPAPAAPPADLTPAAPGEVGTPADDTSSLDAGVAKSNDDPVFKSLVAAAVKEALDTQAEQHSAVVKALEDRVAALEAPASRRVLRNGQLPPEHLLRGQNNGAPVVDPSQGTELRKALANSTDAGEQKVIHDTMQNAAYEAIVRMHQQGPRR